MRIACLCGISVGTGNAFGSAMSMRIGLFELLASISALTAAACGNSQTDCKQSLCGCGTRGGTQTVHKPYLQCSVPDASGDSSSDAMSDAAMDASTDASDDAS